VYEYYDLLGVDRNADAESIERAFRARIRELHPDRDDGTGTEEVVRLKRARAVLTDPALRKDYDRLGHRKFVERERGAGADDVELRSTGDDRSPAARSRSHTRPRESRLERPGTEAASTRRRSAPVDSTARSSVDQDRSTSDEVRVEAPATHQRDGLTGSESTTEADDPETAFGETADDVGIPEDFPTNVGTTEQRERIAADDLESVVALDDLLEETNVGSVDPKELLSNTDGEGHSDETATPDQGQQEEPSTELDSVVALDDLLEETNVGSVDPKELLSGTGRENRSTGGSSTTEQSDETDTSGRGRRLQEQRPDR
jgi:hypothetical protein